MKDDGLAFPKKRKTAKKLTTSKVQEIFNAAIRRRDGRCMTPEGPCSGNLECSHFYAKGGNGSLRFYPPNCWTQCSRHHFDFHNRNVMPYVDLMQNVDQAHWMKRARGCTIRYGQETLHMVVAYCKADDLDGLTDYVEGLINLQIGGK
jgi:uncharacterized DUF497 family protein